MENSSIYLRNQIWYWHDPIYGEKEAKRTVDLGEATVRFSRYVLIVQNSNTINGSLLVVPCSSSKTSDTDVPIPIAHLYHSGITYIRVHSVFPVSPKALQRYICTVPDHVMKDIELGLIQLLAPTVTNNMKKSFVKAFPKREIIKKETILNVPYEIRYMNIYPVNLTAIPKAISRLANTMKITLQQHAIYDSISSQYVSESDKPEYPEDFYVKICSVLYYSMMEYLGLKPDKENKGGFIYPKITSKNPRAAMCFMLDRIYNNGEMPNEYSGSQLMKEYREQYGKIVNGFDVKWLTGLKNKIITKLALNEAAADEIATVLSEVYC